MTSVSSAEATACQVIKCGHMPVLFLKNILLLNRCQSNPISQMLSSTVSYGHSVLPLVCQVCLSDSTQTDLSLEIGVTVRTCVYACVGPLGGVDSRVVSNVSQSRGLGVSFGSGVLIFGCDWDFSARLRGCQHIRMLHSIKAV